ncbi:MAG: CheR family methyltransferase [Solirubrobacteraceae bacterium]|jgi:two-component system CheB/CheR fusion protein
MAQTRGTTVETLLEFVKDTRGFDFMGYKRSSLERRIRKRMGELEIESYDDYLDHLQFNSGEFVELFNTILINVTRFFRDPPAWEYLATDVVPQLVIAHPPDTPIRVWCAGCASGEEAYTVAMVFARALGDDAFRNRVKIYATDVDEEALDYARHGSYLLRQMEDVPYDAIERFFERADQRYVFRNDLRRCVIFGRNDLVQDAPISRIDLLVCRNTLMYFTADTQSQILRRFHFALDDSGVMLLGKSEMLINHTTLFTPANLKWRVFRKVVRRALRDRVRALTNDAGNGAASSITDNLREAAFDLGQAAQIVLDASGVMVMANDRARRLFSLGVNDFGRPIQDLELSYRPVELRSHLDSLVTDLRPVDLPAVGWRSREQEHVLDLRLAPLVGDGILIGTSVTYLDVTEPHRLQEELTSSKRELGQAYEELQSTVEELETTNEELQSTNEELETTNEELQSTNEELETMNEELQSSNEELETMNDELRHRTLELNQMNMFLEKILTTIGLAVAVLDRDQRVQIWNGTARDLWGLSADEAEDRPLLGLDIGLPLDQVKSPLRAVLTGGSSGEEIVVESTNRRGKVFQCRVKLLPLGYGSDHTVSGVLVMMEPVDR